MTAVCLQHNTRPDGRVFLQYREIIRSACFLLVRSRLCAADLGRAVNVMPARRCRVLNQFLAKKPCLRSQRAIFENNSHCYQCCCARRLRRQVRLRNMPYVGRASDLLGTSSLAKEPQLTSGVNRCFDRWRTHLIIRNVWELTAGTAARF